MENYPAYIEQCIAKDLAEKQLVFTQAQNELEARDNAAKTANEQLRDFALKSLYRTADFS